MCFAVVVVARIATAAADGATGTDTVITAEDGED